MPACPVAPATNTVPGSFLRPNDNPEEGLVITGIRDETSDTLPKLKEKGAELVDPFSWLSSDGPSDCLPRRKAERGPALLAYTLSDGFLRVSLGWGGVVRRNELEVRVGAMNG